MTATIAIHPIKTDADVAEATQRLYSLRDSAPGSIEDDEASILADLIEAYEARHHPLPAFTGRDLLAQCMVDANLSQSRVPEIGPQSVVSAVLAGKRAINARMAVALARRFHLPVDAFLIS